MSNVHTKTPRPFVVLVSIVAVTSLGLFAFSLRVTPLSPSPWIWVVVALAALSELFSFEAPNFTFSLAFALAMSAVALGGPALAAIAAASSAISLADLKSKPPLVMLFNLSQLSLIACAGGWVYIMAGGRVLAHSDGSLAPFSAGDFPGALWGIVACALVVSLGNIALTSAGVGLYQGESVRRVFLSVAALVPTELSLAFVGFLIAQIVALNPWALPLFLFPLVMARQLYQRYLGLTLAYADTVRSMIGALEAKDPYTRGHSERVSSYAAALGIAMGFEPKALERLEYAALLHDVGKLAVPGEVLTKPGRLEPEEMDRIREHPARGADMVRRIPPLRDLAETVEQHHERIDGTGYPAGITGDELSLAARVLAVADCYDAMTTTRAYRPALERAAAIAELLDGADAQFDSRVVDRFITARVGEDANDPLNDVFPSLSGPSDVPTQGD